MLDTDIALLKGLIPPKIRPPPWVRQRVNWKHPISRGLTVVMLFEKAATNAYNMRALYSKHGRENDVWDYGTSALRVVGECGLGITGERTQIRLGIGTNVVPSTNGTVLAHTRPSFAGGAAIQSDLFLATGFRCEQYSDGKFYAGWWSGTRASVSTSGLWSAGETLTIGVTWDSTTTAFYTKGVSRATASNSTFASSGPLETPWSGATGAGSGTHAVFIWDRTLPASEMLLLEHSPYCFLEPDIVAPWFSAPSGPTYTMVAETGEFTLTGQSAGLLAGRKLVAGTGEFTLAGQDAGLRAGRRIVAEPGEFNVTGQNVTLTYSGVPPEPEPESETVSGGWVDPRIARKIIRQAKAYHKAIDEQRADKMKKEADLMAFLEQTYARITGEPLPESAEEVAEVIAAEPAATTMGRVADAIAVYATIIPLADRSALDQAFEALDRLLMEARADMDLTGVIEAADAQDRELLALMTEGANLLTQMAEITDATLRI